MSEPKEKCKGKIRKGDAWRAHYTPCPRYAIKDGFCERHAPDFYQKREAKWQAKWDAKDKEQARQVAIAAAACRVLEAAEKWSDEMPGSSLAAAVDSLREARKA